MTPRRWRLSSMPALALAALLPAAAQARARADLQVHTDLRHTTACLPLVSGDLLAGTHGGLVELDRRGRIRRLWTRLDGLPGTRVHALLKEGNKLWVGTDRGLAAMTISTKTKMRISNELRLHLSVDSAPVRAITRHEGKLYLGTWGEGLLRLAPHARRASRVRFATTASGPTPGARGRVTALASFDGTLYVATAGAGLWRLDREDDQLRRVPASDHLPSSFVWSLASTGAGGLLVGTLGGLVQIDRSGTVRQLHAADVRALAVSGQDGRVALAGSYGQGLLGLVGLRVRSMGASMGIGMGNDSLKRAFVNGVGLAHGTLCVGTQDGLWLRRGTGSMHRVQLLGPPSNDITALARDGRRLYVGTFDQGLSVLDTGNGQWQRISGVDRRIDALLVQGSTLWVGTPRGLYRVRDLDGRHQVRRFDRADGLRHEHVHSLAPLKDGGVLVGTGLGAAILSDGGRRVEPINVKQGLPVASVWAVAEDAEGMLWIGTSKGLYRWSRTRRRYERFSVSSGHLSDDWVTGIAIHGGSVFVGTYNAGVCWLRRDSEAAGRWRSTRLGGGWVNFAGLTIHDRTRTLYAATMKGLRALSLGDLGGRLALTLVDRAAPGQDVTAVLGGPGGGLWIASRRGLARR